MESLNELKSGGGNEKYNFFKHVFNFDHNARCDYLNIIQYSLLVIIPIIIFNKIMQRVVPSADEEKSSIELIIEVLIQVIVTFLVMPFIHRIVTFVPTYSGEKYSDFNVIYIIIPILIVILSLQTKLGEKVSILVDRLTELWEGPKETMKNGKNSNKKGQVKVSQPISQNQAAMSQSLNSMGSTSQNMGTTSISSLPVSQATQQVPDYSHQYPSENSGQASVGVGFADEPMAANSGMSAFGSAFGGNW